MKGVCGMNELDRLAQEVSEEVRARVAFEGGIEHAQDMKWGIIEETAESFVPVYSSDLLALVVANPALATITPHYGVAEDSTAADLVTTNVYEYFLDIATETYESLEHGTEE